MAPTTCCRTAELDQHQTGSVYLSSESLKHPQFSTTLLVMRSGAQKSHSSDIFLEHKCL